ncbi:MAG: ybeY [Chitinophagaceae bacterium]|nr:ybeY [Chitinophagaceae bacterium]
MSSKTDKAIKFFFLNVDITLKGRNRLKNYLNAVFRKEGKTVEFVNYIFCSDEFLLEINKNYLKHDYYTDIITFDLSDERKKLRAEIYISVDRVRDNSGKLGVSIKSELHRVIFHGALHLCGYGDKSEREIAKMRREEEYHIKKYLGVPRGTVPS